MTRAEREAHQLIDLYHEYDQKNWLKKWVS